jgi:signal recognition particle subunit SRP54
MSRIEAILSSMTAGERRDHSVMNGSRRKRIASGSGTSVEEVNRLLKQFTEMRRMLQTMGQGGMAGIGKGMEMPQGIRAGSSPSGFGSGKKRKKGGPWGLMRTR